MAAPTRHLGAGLLSWLRPDRNPFYLITIAAVLTLSFAALEGYESRNWNFVFYLVGFVVLINLTLSLIPQEIDDEEYEKNLRFARSVGIATATLSLFALNETLKYSPNDWILYLVLAQVLVFSLYLLIGIFVKRKVSEINSKRINNFQLCLTTSVLLFGIIINYNPFYSENVKRIESKAAYERENQFLADSINNTDINFLIDSAVTSFNDDSQRSEDVSFESANVVECRYSVYRLFFFAWVVCILVWIYQLKRILSINVNLKDSID